MSATLTTAPVAPYCVTPEGDAWLRPRVEAARRLVLREVGQERVEGLILTGSLARGEASVLCEGSRCRLLGDVEFLLVVRPRPGWRQLRRDVHSLGLLATERLSEGVDRFTVEYTPADISYLRQRARPSAFTWDLRHHGRVLFGRADLALEIPDFERAALPASDSVDTLANRGLELLALEAQGASPDVTSYALAKALLDAAGSALAFTGTYESLYARRAGALRELVSRREDLRRAVAETDRLAELVETAARVKLQPTREALEHLSRETNARSVRRWLSELWRWEASLWLGRPGDAGSLIGAYLGSEPWSSRLRGWVKYAWHPLRPRSAPLRPGLLGLAARGSPRRLVYSAALLALEGAAGWEERAARLLPATQGSGRGILRQILEAWTWLIRNN
jgi:hypothetical protein